MPDVDPAARAIDLQADRGDKAKDQKREGNDKEKPPTLLPPMVVHHCADQRAEERNCQPECLAFDEEIDVAMAFLRERAGAEKHDDAEGGQARQR